MSKIKKIYKPIELFVPYGVIPTYGIKIFIPLRQDKENYYGYSINNKEEIAYDSYTIALLGMLDENEFSKSQNRILKLQNYIVNNRKE